MSQVETPRSPAALMLLLLCIQAFTAEIAAKRASSRGLHHERTKSEARQVQDHLVYIRCPWLLLLLLLILTTKLPLSAAKTL